MQDKYYRESPQSHRTAPPEHDSRSKLEQIKQQVKAWFADEEEGDNTQGSRYAQRAYPADRQQFAGNRGSGYANHYPEQPNGGYGTYSPGYGNQPYPRDDLPATRPQMHSGFVDFETRDPRNAPGYRSSQYEQSAYQQERTGFGYGNPHTAPAQYSYSEHRMVPGPYVGSGPKGFQRSSDKLQEQVSERLENDGRICASEIEVEVAGGEITLNGKVPSRDQKRMAEECAESVWGVKDVHNRLTIDPSVDNRKGSNGSNGSTFATSVSDSTAVGEGIRQKRL